MGHTLRTLLARLRARFGICRKSSVAAEEPIEVAAAPRPEPKRRGRTKAAVKEFILARHASGQPLTVLTVAEEFQITIGHAQQILNALEADMDRLARQQRLKRELRRKHRAKISVACERRLSGGVGVPFGVGVS